MSIIMTGGGTGGHLTIIKAVKEELLNEELIYIGSTKGQDQTWFGEDKQCKATHFLPTQGVVNQGFLGKIKSLLMILKEMIKCIKIYNTYNVAKVISVGGFSAAPASFATIFTKNDFYIHEQNSIMGRLNQITSKFAKEVFSSYNQNSSIKDYPINTKFFKYSRIRDNINTIIFLGGSQGAKAINDFAIKIAPSLQNKNIKIIHQTGKDDFENIKQKYHDLNIDATVFNFSKDILVYMNKADFAISRSGASTLWELSALGLPTLYIPYPYAAANHQYHNAKFLHNNKLCFLKIQKELNETVLEDILNADIQTISKNLINTIQKDGTKKIVDKILS